MKKKVYIKPEIESFSYRPEEGYANTVALHKDFMLLEGKDGSTLRAAEEVTEYTDDAGEWTTGDWIIESI
ncbi:MAG: hypothetical protein IJ745_06410 [Bacteroidales bacterium]|nr:hypothetical protein [Bacteroidales bacterium]